MGVGNEGVVARAGAKGLHQPGSIDHLPERIAGVGTLILGLAVEEVVDGLRARIVSS